MKKDEGWEPIQDQKEIEGIQFAEATAEDEGWEPIDNPEEISSIVFDEEPAVVTPETPPVISDLPSVDTTLPAAQSGEAGYNDAGNVHPAPVVPDVIEEIPEKQPPRSLWQKAKDWVTKGTEGEREIVAAIDGSINRANASLSDAGSEIHIQTNKEKKRDNLPLEVYDLFGKLANTREYLGVGDDAQKMKSFDDTMKHIMLDKLHYKSLRKSKKTGYYSVMDDKGEWKELNEGSADAILGSALGDKWEMGGGYAGAKLAWDGTKWIKNPLLRGVVTAAGGAIGAASGSLVDTYLNALETGQKLTVQQYASEMNKAAVIDGVGAMGGAVLPKALGMLFVDLPVKSSKAAYKYLANGNLPGARKVFKTELGVDDAYLDNALKGMETWQEEITDSKVDILSGIKSIMNADDKKKAAEQLWDDAVDGLANAKDKEELLAAAMSHPLGGNMLEGALTSNPKGAIEFTKSADARVNQAYSALDAATGTEIKKSVNAYEDRVKAQYSDMRETFKEAFKESNYRFDLDDLKIEESIKSMGDRIGDDHVRKQFEAMSSAVKAQIEGKRAGAGVTRDIDDLLNLWQKMNRFYGKYGKHLDAPDAKVFSDIKKNIGQEVDRALEEHTTPEISSQLRGYFDDARDEYAQMYAIKGTKLYKELMSEGKSAEGRVNSLLKHAKDDKGELQQMLGKLTPEESGRAEDAIIQSVMQKYTVGTSGEMRSMDTAKVLRDLEELRPFLKSEASQQSIDLLSDMYSKFRHDFRVAAVASGTKVGSPSAGIATSWQGKLEAHTAGKIFNYVTTMIPIGSNPKRLALQRHLAAALRKSRTPLDMAKQMRESKALTFDQRAELKELIKIHNRALSAKNKKSAEKVEKELKAFEARIEEERVRKALEVTEFETPHLSELRAVEHLAGDDRYATLAQTVRRIQDNTASETDIKRYIEARDRVSGDLSDRVEKERINLFPQKYRNVGEEDIAKIKKIAGDAGDDAFDTQMVRRLIYDLEQKGMPRNSVYDDLFDDILTYGEKDAADPVPLDQVDLDSIF